MIADAASSAEPGANEVATHNLHTLGIGPLAVEIGPFGAPHTLTGHIHILRRFRSVALDNTRDVTIYLPPAYFDPDATGRRYPVLYMHDGQNLFDASTAFIPGHDWRLDETAEALIRANHIAPIIIVGIDHARDARMQELTPTYDARLKAGGHGADYARMITNELKPYVDAYYRTRPERDATGVGGSSLGGLISLHLGIAHPDVFGRLALLSPSLWWDRRRLLQEVRGMRMKLPLRIWLDVGTREGGGTLQNVRMLKNALLRLGWTRGVDFNYLEAPGAIHTEDAWASRVGLALEFLFPPSIIADRASWANRADASAAE